MRRRRSYRMRLFGWQARIVAACPDCSIGVSRFTICPVHANRFDNETTTKPMEQGTAS